MLLSLWYKWEGYKLHLRGIVWHAHVTTWLLTDLLDVPCCAIIDAMAMIGAAGLDGTLDLCGCRATWYRCYACVPAFVLHLAL